MTITKQDVLDNIYITAENKNMVIGKEVAEMLADNVYNNLFASMVEETEKAISDYDKLYRLQRIDINGAIADSIGKE